MWFRNLVLFAGLVAVSVIPAAAQPVIAAKSGTIAKAEGKVFLGDQVIEESLTKFPDIKENGVVRTEEGRAEVLLTPGTVLHLGENSSFRLVTNRLIDTRLELLTGSAVLDAEQIQKDTNVTLVLKDGTITFGKAGHYRFDAEPARIKVFEGTADVQLRGQHIEVGSGKMLGLTGEVALAEKFDRNDTDSLDNWARRRCEIMAMANVSSAKSVYNSYSPVAAGGMWSWNPYFGLYTYIPGSGRFCDPLYGYCYWSPGTVNRIFYQPPPALYTGNSGGGYSPSYTSMAPTSGGYSGAMASGSSSVSSAPAAAASTSSAASSSGGASAGHGSGGGGGRGH
ncbi:MAG TPA: FecR domain-containing protein [Bryobacteraceae bacterium]|nr:FecR domain-containing protein [Bryobacteraceae bacterium]